jgi:hypothetical protein
MFVLCSILSVSPTIAAPIATLLLFVWNYVAAHWAIVMGRYPNFGSVVAAAQSRDARTGK